MMTKLEKVRDKLNKALEVYPFESEMIMKLSKELDQLINKSYVRMDSCWRLQRK